MIEKAAISMAPPQPCNNIEHVYVFTCPFPDHWIQSLARVYVCARVSVRARLLYGYVHNPNPNPNPNPHPNPN